MNQTINRAVSILTDGGVVAYPTDTVYGLGADAFNQEAVNLIYRIKHRPAHQPLSVLVADPGDITVLTGSLPDSARLLIARFWPGGLTLVVKKTSRVPEWVTAGGDTVAIRMPDHPITLELVRKLGKPLIGTSANLSGSPSPKTAAEVRMQLGSAVDLVLDGGTCPGGVESTVVDVSGKSPVIHRAGIITREAIESVIGVLPAQEKTR